MHTHRDENLQRGGERNGEDKTDKAEKMGTDENRKNHPNRMKADAVADYTGRKQGILEDTDTLHGHDYLQTGHQRIGTGDRGEKAYKKGNSQPDIGDNVEGAGHDTDQKGILDAEEQKKQCGQNTHQGADNKLSAEKTRDD